MKMSERLDGCFELVASPSGKVVAASVSRPDGRYSVDAMDANCTAESITAGPASAISIPHGAFVTHVAFVDETCAVSVALDGRLRLLDLAKGSISCEVALGEGSSIPMGDERCMSYSCAVYRKPAAGTPSSSSTASATLSPSTTSASSVPSSSSVQHQEHQAETVLDEIRVVSTCNSVLEVFQLVGQPGSGQLSFQRIGKALEHLHADVINQVAMYDDRILVSGGDDCYLTFVDLWVWEDAVRAHLLRKQAAAKVDGNQGSEDTAMDEGGSDEQPEEGVRFTIHNQENVRSFLALPKYGAVLCASTNETLNVWSFGSDDAAFGNLSLLVSFTDEFRKCPELYKPYRCDENGTPYFAPNGASSGSGGATTSPSSSSANGSAVDDGFVNSGMEVECMSYGCILGMFQDNGKIYVLAANCLGEVVMFHMNLHLMTVSQVLGQTGTYFLGDATTGENHGTDQSKRRRPDTNLNSPSTTVMTSSASAVAGASVEGQLQGQKRHFGLPRCFLALKVPEGTGSAEQTQQHQFLSIRELWTGDENGCLIRWPTKGKKRHRDAA
ncbi:unnamed protein product [Amoebophrya sp. A25]|nr:unnamed protein product [Amoebophrya sp. A25]|eukprot:GSA25T00004214001.1